MVVLIGIALILLLLVLIEPRNYPAQSRGWTGFVAGPDPRPTDHDGSVGSELRVLR
jgi:hypothetical protein